MPAPSKEELRIARRGCTRHLRMHRDGSPAETLARLAAYAEEHGLEPDHNGAEGAVKDLRIWGFPGSEPTDFAAWRLVELTVGDATLELSVEEARAVIVRYVTG